MKDEYLKEEKFGEELDRPDEGEAKDMTNLDAEIKAGEWQTLRRFKTYRQRSRQGKILATYQAVSNRLRQLELMFYKLVRDHPKKSERLLYEIKQLRLVQDILLQCLVWEPAGELEEDMIPGELWELIA